MPTSFITDVLSSGRVGKGEDDGHIVSDGEGHSEQYDVSSHKAEGVGV